MQPFWVTGRVEEKFGVATLGVLDVRTDGEMAANSRHRLETDGILKRMPRNDN
jgi:hypothetical protein